MNLVPAATWPYPGPYPEDDRSGKVTTGWRTAHVRFSRYAPPEHRSFDVADYPAWMPAPRVCNWTGSG